MTPSWHASTDLKARVLAVLESHRVIAKLERFALDDRTFNFYGWREPADFATMEKAFGIPRAVLQLGWYLFEGFPEGPASIRALIADRAKLLDAIPVGRQLGEVATELAYWLLTDPAAGLRAMIVDAQAIAALIDEAALAVLGPNPTILARLDDEAGRWSDEIPRQWQRDHRIEPQVYRNQRVLEVAMHCLAGKPIAAIGTLTTGVFPSGDRAPPLEPIAAKFIALVAG